MYSSSIMASSAGAGLGLGLMGKLGHAWMHGVGGFVNDVLYCFGVGVGGIGELGVGHWGSPGVVMVVRELNSPTPFTHAQPSLPVNPDPNPAPAEDSISGLHDTAAV